MSGSLWLTVLTAAAAVGGAGGGGGAAAVELPRSPINHLVGGSVPSYCCHVSLNTADRIKGEVGAKHKTSTLRSWTSSWCIRLELSVIKGLIKPPTTHMYNEINFLCGLLC